MVSTAIDQLNDAIIKGSGIFGNLAENCKAYEKASERYTTALQELNIALSEFDDIEDSDAPEEAKEAAKRRSRLHRRRQTMQRKTRTPAR